MPKKRSITFVVKASKFGSQKNGDRRSFVVPLPRNKEIIDFCGEDKVKVTITRLDD